MKLLFVSIMFHSDVSAWSVPADVENYLEVFDEQGIPEIIFLLEMSKDYGNTMAKCHTMNAVPLTFATVEEMKLVALFLKFR